MASSTASSMEVKLTKGTTGPKTSSLKRGISGATFMRTVGAMNDPLRLPPARTVAPAFTAPVMLEVHPERGAVEVVEAVFGLAALQADPATARRAVPLLTLGRALDFMQRAPIGSHPGVGPEVGAGIDSDLTALLAGLGVPPETRDVLQVDLYRAAPDLALSPAVRRALEDGAETLRRLAPPPSAGPLDRFRAAFTERYGTRWVPLLEALDEESGIGFDGAPSHDSPLLEDLIFQSAPPAPALSPRDRFLLRQIPRWQGSPTWELEEADVEALAQPDPPPLPASFAALATLAAPSSAALDRGEFQFWTRGRIYGSRGRPCEVGWAQRSCCAGCVTGSRPRSSASSGNCRPFRTSGRAHPAVIGSAPSSAALLRGRLLPWGALPRRLRPRRLDSP